MAWLNLGFKSPWLHSTRPSTASLMAGRVSAESNALSKRTRASKGFIHARICFSKFLCPQFDEGVFVYILCCADEKSIGAPLSPFGRDKSNSASFAIRWIWARTEDALNSLARVAK